MDLGFVVSNDGIHYTEPVPDFHMISAYEIMGEGEEGGAYGQMVPAPTLQQGQGFENVGDETLIWYAPWHHGFICVARWPKDRLGYAEVVRDPKPDLLMPEDTHTLFWKKHKPDIPIDKTDPHLISCPIELDRSDARVFVNADGLSDVSRLTVEVLDEQFNPMPGYSGDDCEPLTESGLREAVSWRNRTSLENFDGPIRLKVKWDGDRLEDANLYTIYLSLKEE